MTVLEALRELRWMAKDIEQWRERIDRLRSATEGMTQRPRDGARGTAEQDHLAAAVAMIEGMQRTLFCKIVEREKVLLDAEQFVDTLPVSQRAIIRMKYFDGMSWAAVSRAAAYDERWCRRLHDRAVRRLSIIWKPEVRSEKDGCLENTP